MLVRGFHTDVEYKAVLNQDGSVRGLAIRGATPKGDAAEIFEMVVTRFHSPIDHGEEAGADDDLRLERHTHRELIPAHRGGTARAGSKPRRDAFGARYPHAAASHNAF